MYGSTVSVGERMDKIGLCVRRILHLSGFFYMVFSASLHKNNWSCFKEIHLERGMYGTSHIKSISHWEIVHKRGVSKKILEDLKHHKIVQDGETKTVTQVLIDKEGKISGYKVRLLFRPNYFTKNRSLNLITKKTQVKLRKINLQMMNIKIHHLKG